MATAAFWRTFHCDEKISPGWCGWGVHAHPLSLYLPSRTKLLRGQIYSPYFVSTPMYSVVKSTKNICPRICGGYNSRCSDHPAHRGVDLLLWKTRSQASMQNSCVADPDPGSVAFLTPGSGSHDPGWFINQDPAQIIFPRA